MKILCVCEEGNNRSVNLAQRLRYLGNETIAVGTKRHTIMTIRMLMEWADLVIAVDRPTRRLLETIPGFDQPALWDLGPDNFPRPFNPILNNKITQLIEEHKDAVDSRPLPRDRQDDRHSLDVPKRAGGVRYRPGS